MSATISKRNGFWSGAVDFLRDNNATKPFVIRLGTWAEAATGGCGPRPDVAAMANEAFSKADIEADARGLFGNARLQFNELFALVQNANRIMWLQNQVLESLKTGTAPFDLMSSDEQRWFLKQFNSRPRYQSLKQQQQTKPHHD